MRRLSALALVAAASMSEAATLVVTNPASLGPGTLRQALSDNQALGGGNTIVFASNVTTITLQGELSVNSRVTILGPGPELLSVSGNNLSRIFSVTAGPTLISGLMIRNGRVTGAEGNQMQNGEDAVAGGVWNFLSTLTLSNCVVVSNSLVGGKGGQRAQGNVGRGGRVYGGGIHNDGGALELINTTLEGNSATGGGGGDAVNGNAGEGGDAFGGAVYSLGGTNLIVACDFKNNLVRGGAGGNSGGMGTGGFGGSGYGAGLYNEGATSVAGSTFHDNNAMGGAGGSAGTAGSNGGGFGGGIATISSLILVSSTIVSNSATGSTFDNGGGISNGGDLAVTNCTIANNVADSGGGLNGTASAGGTIFAGNTAATGPDVNGTINSSDYNLIQNTNGLTLLGAISNVIVGQDPLLGPLQDNGGPTLTMALLPGSPAIDQGNSFGLTADQRGVARPQDVPTVADAAGGDGSDIGAYEFLAPPHLSIQTAANNNVVLSWPASAADFRLQSATNPAGSNAWSEVNTPRVTIGNQLYTTNPTADPSRLYRLIFP